MTTAVALVVISLVTDDDLAHRVWAGFLAVVILVRHRTNVIARWRAWRVYGLTCSSTPLVVHRSLSRSLRGPGSL